MSSKANLALGPARPRKRFELDREAWLAVDAWRSPGGLGLCYLVRLEEGVPTEDDRADRRASLQRADDLELIGDEGLRELWAAGRPLTATERRVADDDGELWLVRNTGPVWADAAAAAATTGVRFRCLTRVGLDIEADSVQHVGDRTQEDLRRLLAEARMAP